MKKKLHEYTQEEQNKIKLYGSILKPRMKYPNKPFSLVITDDMRLEFGERMLLYEQENEWYKSENNI